MGELVTIGEALLRLAAPGDERIEATDRFAVGVGGPEVGASVAADRLGVPTTFLTKVPDSALGRRVEAELRRYGVGTRILRSEAGRQGVYYHERGGEPRGTKSVYDRDNSSFRTASVDDFDHDLVRDARVFYVSGETPSLSRSMTETTADLMSAARDAGTTVAFDLHHNPSLLPASRAETQLTQLLPAVDVLFVSLGDARTVLGHEEGGAPRVAHKLASLHDLGTVVVTRTDGACVWHDNVVHSHDGFDATVANPIGADDAFHGAFLARRLLGDDIESALAYGGAAAAIKRTLPSDVALIGREEVEDLVYDG
ncbi:2-keto-3-deoxygluconate kinase [Halobacteriales archaeon SW_7_68_16]|nr:MAG: 2-keto-3-deoxygluconate kinase [Halobacteriales archaeon SW_7_68_16]